VNAHPRLLGLLINKKNWALLLGVIFLASASGLVFIGYETHTQAPPIPDYVDASGAVVVARDDVLAGQALFQQKALMSYGSMFGDGALRGPDFTAEALHQVGRAMRAFYRDNAAPGQEPGRAASAVDAVSRRVIREIKANRYDPDSGRVSLLDSQVYAFERLVDYYRGTFGDPAFPEAFPEAGYIDDPRALRDLAAFFFWGAWVSGTERPGFGWSYTHNWPYDESVGNTVTRPTVIWSVSGVFALLLGLGFTLYVYGQFQRLPIDPLTPPRRWRPLSCDGTPTQFVAMHFFVLAALLFLLQVLAGVLTIADFVGVESLPWLPVTVSRSLHTQLALLWIGSAWMGATLFILPMATDGHEPAGQATLARGLLALLLIVATGGLAAIVLGPTGAFGPLWSWLGHQGWEFMEAGRLWQALLFVAFALWAVMLVRGLWPVLSRPGRWHLPDWLVYCVVGILLLFVSAFMFTPETNFVIADFWRWMVIHMWVEAFFEVFTTIVVAYLLVLMGQVNRVMAERTIFLAAVLFLGSGLLGISHNFYWNAKPTGTLALGAVFSTLQVVPLILLTMDGWRMQRRESQAHPALRSVWQFILAVSFWNFLGAGVFGFIINLPVVNYFQHGSYLTVNHAHAALMGVYGNLSLAAILFCCHYLIPERLWNARLLTVSFWCLNIGLALMVLLNLLPVGVVQLDAILEHGYWWARSREFVASASFQTLTWLRAVGGNLFFWGGLLPLVWFVVSRAAGVRARRRARPGAATEAWTTVD